MIKILLLEDDILFAQTLIDFLEDDYDVTHIENGEEFIDSAYEESYDLYLLDINVPKINGLEVLNHLRQNGDNIPSIFLTSYKDSDTLKQGFINGADDYLKKPFDMDELCLRISSLLKRSGKIIQTINIDDIEYNPSLRTIKKAGLTIPLGAKVIDLFVLFYENNGKIVSKEMIIEKLWSYGEQFSEGSIRVYVTKIQKLFDKKRIVNIKNIGYKIEL